MPLPEHTIQPSHISLVAVSQQIENELEYVSNETFCNLMYQMSSVINAATDIFDELSTKLASLSSRFDSVNERVASMSETVKRLPTTEDCLSVGLQNLSVQPFASNKTEDSQVLHRNTKPNCMKLCYEQAEPPPPLHIMDALRDDGKTTSRLYSDPRFFFDLWSKEMLEDCHGKKTPRRRQRPKAKAKTVGKGSLSQKPPGFDESLAAALGTGQCLSSVQSTGQLVAPSGPPPPPPLTLPVSTQPLPPPTQQHQLQQQSCNAMQHPSGVNGGMKSSLPPPPPPPPPQLSHEYARQTQPAYQWQEPPLVGYTAASSQSNSLPVHQLPDTAFVANRSAIASDAGLLSSLCDSPPPPPPPPPPPVMELTSNLINSDIPELPPPFISPASPHTGGNDLPPPPPPDPDAHLLTSDLAHSGPRVSCGGAAPPPPPPPPTSPQSSQSVPGAPSSNSTSTKLVGPPRDLLSDIRAGFQLRKVSERLRVENSSAKSTANAAPVFKNSTAGGPCDVSAILEVVRKRRQCMENTSEDDDDKTSDSCGWDD